MRRHGTDCILAYLCLPKAIWNVHVFPVALFKHAYVLGCEHKSAQPLSSLAKINKLCSIAN